MSSTAVPILQMPDPRGSTIIGKSVTIKGQIISQEDLTIDGEVEGSVELQGHRLTVGPSGRLEADVRAHEIVVFGSIQGKVEATEKIDIKKQASIFGEIKAARIVTEDGAYLKGTIDTNRAQPSNSISKVGAAGQIQVLEEAVRSLGGSMLVPAGPSV